MNSGENIFFIVGAQRCGTSYLAQMLHKHSSIRMAQPLFPEPKFFLSTQEFQKGKEYYLKKFFEERKGEELLGEKSTSYIESTEAALRIKEMFPSAKIIILLRNPIYRAISNYQFSKSNKVENRSLNEALFAKAGTFDKQKFSVSPFDYLGRGEYIKYIRAYQNIFERERIKVLILENLIRDAKEWNHLFDFLEVNRMVPDSLGEKINESIKIENYDHKILEQLQSYFTPYNKELEKFLNIDLSLWKL